MARMANKLARLIRQLRMVWKADKFGPLDSTVAWKADKSTPELVTFERQKHLFIFTRFST